jgi:4-amino-4-deoxy-L-arabinose transferase-like glycosyltransferase
MLQPWIVVPAFAVAYLVGSRASVGRRVRDLLLAGVALLASSAWWVGLVAFWPGPKPYFGGSTNGSVLDLVFGYNGLGRIFGQSAGQPMAKGAPGGPAGSGFPGGEPVGGAAGGRIGFDGGSSITRMFNQEVGGQISWLLPLCLLVLIVVAVAGLQRMRAKQPTDPARRAGWFLWGGWLLTTALVFSFMGGIFHPYYTTQLAPAVAALTAAGLAVMWRHYRRPGGYTWLLLPAAVVLNAVWAWVLVSRDTSWHGWLRYPVAAVAVLSVVLLVVGRLSTSGGLPLAGTVLGVVALLLAPGVWSAATAFASGPGGGPGGQAGPAPKPSLSQDVAPVGSSGAVGLRPGTGGAPGPVKFFSGGAGRDLSDEQRKILQYAQANSRGARVTLAIEGGAAAAEPYIINTDAAVVGMGGFSGQDAAPTSDQLAQWVQQHQLRFVLAPGRHDDAGGGPQGNNGPGPNAVIAGPFDPSTSLQRTQWVQQHCTVVDPSAYGGSTEQKQNAEPPTPFGNNVLYDCQAH